MRAFLLVLGLWMMAQPVTGQARYSVVISEFMADPSPPVGLPVYEWVEVRNRSGQIVNLDSWRLVTRSGASGPFPATTLSPDSCLIIGSFSAFNSLQAYGKVMSVSGFPSLSNDEGLIWLEDSGGNIIHAVQYSLKTYQSDIKQAGGWSLEMIDLSKPCIGSANWSASTDVKGGTPGAPNSINAHIQQAPFHLLKAYAPDSMRIIAIFSDAVDSSSGEAAGAYQFRAGPLVQKASPVAPLFNEVQLELDAPLRSQTLYQFKAAGVMSCTGTPVDENDIAIGLPSQVAAKDLVINEILVNPAPNAFDYVELFNRGKKIVDAASLALSLRNGAGSLESITRLSDSSFPILPAGFALITKDLASLKRNYHVADPENVVEVSGLPSFPDDAGDIVLSDLQGTVIDEVKYSDSWQFPLLVNAEGVSLERLNADAGSSDPENWHSASSGAGYGTPGYVNSQAQHTGNTGVFSVRPEVFSPDNDGRDDIATVTYQLHEAMMGTIVIFDRAGKIARTLVNNRLLGPSGTCTWDG
ncbi:MAG TPA: lamin tail domain-containing protein, partial [Chitinophagaceae bacterium]